MLAPGLLVVHDTSGGGENDETELTGRKELGNPLLDIAEAHVVAGRDAAWSMLVFIPFLCKIIVMNS